MRTIQCHSKFDQENVYIIEKSDQFFKFAVTNVQNDKQYLTCVSCQVLRAKEDKNKKNVDYSKN